MSTNYYFKIDSDCKFCKSKEIHIGKRSAGWRPSFEKTEYYSSVQGIRDFYKENKEELAIVSEYGETLSFEDLEEELINWNKDNKEAWGHDHTTHTYSDSEGYDFFRGEFC